MRNLKRITLFFIVLYILFILMNGFEFFWSSLGIFDPLKKSLIPFAEQEAWVHQWLDILDYAGKLVFLLLCNDVVRKNKWGKGDHFLIVLLSFVPIVYLILSFILWRKLNRYLFIYSEKDFTKSDRKIILIWVLILIRVFVPMVYFVLVNYSDSPELVTTLVSYRNYGLIASTVFALLFSMVYLSYFWEFWKTIRDVGPKIIPISENQLLDN
ncbi:hypothetical protein [Fluviicola sp.]|uniref:hypothetical protein n=1 Tax=Fluviicola sp. TaxID=1917219 RepID=UPI002634ED62|nr:hypothetical protein [Fluviicola sp.]